MLSFRDKFVGSVIPTTSPESERRHYEDARNQMRRTSYYQKLYTTDYPRFERALTFGTGCVKFFRSGLTGQIHQYRTGGVS